ncbi:MAG TPA: outer membrane beta-barrel protein, partial [Longimicrobiaceae bacterium]|nr:outer membrane beta-barrel protein [Longimicrobiaceae bacterium]
TSTALLALLLLATVHAAAVAQEAPAGPNALRKGAWSLSFDLPVGPGSGEELGAGLGVWRMVSGRTNLGVDLDAQYHRTGAEDGAGGEREREFARARLALAARRYLDTGRAVAPFLAGRVGAGIFREATDGDDLPGSIAGRGWSVDASGGAGVEWFPVRGVSVSGSTGVGIDFERSRAPAGPEPGDAETTGFSIGTFTTRLGFRIYF